MQTAMIKNTLPMAAFEKNPRKALADVHATGRQIVMDSGRPVGVLMSPEEYDFIMDLLADLRIEQIAAERLSRPLGECITFDEMLAKSGITKEELDAMPEVEIE